MMEVQSIGAASDRVMAALVAGLEIEFGHGAGEALAERFLAAEESDFCWNARIEERWIGAYASIGEDDIELDRVAVLGRLDGRWFVAVCIIDSDEVAHGRWGGGRSNANVRSGKRSRMRADGEWLGSEERRRIDVASPLLWSSIGDWKGEKGLQDKGSASPALLSLCLHILFKGGRGSRRRGNYLETRLKLTFLLVSREHGCFDALHCRSRRHPTLRAVLA